MAEAATLDTVCEKLDVLLNMMRIIHSDVLAPKPRETTWNGTVCHEYRIQELQTYGVPPGLKAHMDEVPLATNYMVNTYSDGDYLTSIGGYSPGKRTLTAQLETKNASWDCGFLVPPEWSA
jgi:hypothetical protein